MMADAFSMFDYGGGFELMENFSWLIVFVILVLTFQGEAIWLVPSYFSLALEKVVLFFGTSCGKSNCLLGFSMACSSLFFYLSVVGVIGIFPYSFCVTAHFSHNLSISLVLWLSCLFVGFGVSLKSFSASVVPGGLEWLPSSLISVFEVLSILSRSLTLGARLTMNMIAGKLILCIGSSFLGSAMVSGVILSPMGFVFLAAMLVLAGWEMVVGVVQAYILTFLTVQYMNEISLYG
uniref:ATP synthase subunit a n=1 Tax=Scrobicularia plana TaxID=665965 RepID=A0A6H2U258_9BIVA|nr:ATP synthase F0 subunit 6 [Scrobicularia plana]